MLPQSRLWHHLVSDGTLNLGVDRQLLGIVVVALRVDKLGVEKVLVQLCVQKWNSCKKFLVTCTRLAYLAVKQGDMLGQIFPLRTLVIALVAREGSGHGSVAILCQFFNEMPSDVISWWVGHVTNGASFPNGKSPVKDRIS